MKRIKRVVDTGFWSDEKVLDFSPEDKYFMLFLLTNEFTNQLGVYYLPLKKAAFDLGYTIDSVKTLLERFENQYSIIRYSKDTSEVAIKNYLLYSVVKGGKPVFDCLTKDAQSVKNKKLLTFVCQNLNEKDVDNQTIKDFISHLEEFLKESTKENISINDIDNDNDNDNERIVHESSTNRPRIVHKEIIDYLNEKTGSKYRWQTDKTKKMINGRLNDGYTVDDFKRVIDIKVADWLHDPKMKNYLRPETLFAPSHFESYLNQTPQKEVKHDALQDFLNS